MPKKIQVIQKMERVGELEVWEIFAKRGETFRRWANSTEKEGIRSPEQADKDQNCGPVQKSSSKDDKEIWECG